MGAAQSWYSNQCACGEIASSCALSSGNRWLETGKPAASAWLTARNQPVIPPIFMTSSITKSEAPTERLFVRSCGPQLLSYAKATVTRQKQYSCEQLSRARFNRAWYIV